ncbi:hypothetical protein Ahy_B06g082854 [Arachis hypogaea]|uniref:Uncharacterized protein n=1 Tax=Arachis hypogaea TaxID=3818 RepID=A0A444YNZ2_ARAHY|nr:hypothetical protein Ahy_B06g082854 [Arachis hypogaea]
MQNLFLPPNFLEIRTKLQTWLLKLLCQSFQDFPRVLRLAKLSNNGAVLLCKNTGFSLSSLKWRNLLGGHGSSRGVFLCAYVEKVHKA